MYRDSPHISTIRIRIFACCDGRCNGITGSWAAALRLPEAAGGSGHPGTTPLLCAVAVLIFELQFITVYIVRASLMYRIRHKHA